MLDSTVPGSANDRASGGSIVELEGRVKWFDIFKGYGFIVPDNGLPDVLLHITLLQREGFLGIGEGARVKCTAVKKRKGLQVVRVLEVDLSAPMEEKAARPELQVKAMGGFQLAEVKSFSRTRGFGFLTCPNVSEDVFVHMDTLRLCGVSAGLRSGQKVLVRLGPGPKGMMVGEIRRASSSCS